MVQLDNKSAFLEKATTWCQQFQVFTILDSNTHTDNYTNYDCIIAADYIEILEADYQQAFPSLSHFIEKHAHQWLFGGLGYDLKNAVEKLESNNMDKLGFPDCFFFAPKHILLLKGDGLEIVSPVANLYQEIINYTSERETAPQNIQDIQQRLTKEEYIRQVNSIREHIRIGDIYETNFCVEFYAENASLAPATVFKRLNESSSAPFASFMRWFDKYIICASPERFIAKRGNKLISQPIKGTSKRGKNEIEDQQLKEALYHHPKERQENVMIVDLVRNDLSKIAKAGSVRVEELFGIYSFKQVHQMISTVVCEVGPQLPFVEIIKNTFPMGSMTGAPKIKALELMERYEKTKRGIYSGTIGYLDPQGNFDFNVVIRTILYNTNTQYLSFHAGSAITYHADAEKEYEECLLKIKALVKAVNGRLT